jgi:glycosyltransferase involved in cell wall biosynthesis
MKIYFLENENPNKDSSGGIMSYLINLSKVLIKKEHITILCGSGTNKRKVESFSEFINISKKDNPSNLRYIISLFFKIKFLKIDRSSIIHAQRPDMLLPAILFKSKCKLVCSLHGAHDIAVYDKKGFISGLIYTTLQSLSFSYVDLLIAVDRNTANYYIEKYPFIKNKLVIIPIAVDTNIFYPMNKKEVRKINKLNTKDKVVIFVGRLEKEKNIKLIIDAFLKASKEINNLKLLIVGAGREETKLKGYVTSNNIDNVFFTGEVENSIIPELINCADVLALSSFYEGSPTVIKESIACNVPIVSVDVGDVKSVINDIEGCYICDYNEYDFSKKILKVVNSNINLNVNSKINRFSKENIGELTLSAYKSN